MRVQRYLLRGWIVNFIQLLVLGALLFQQISVWAIPVLRSSPRTGPVQTERLGLCVEKTVPEELVQNVRAFHTCSEDDYMLSGGRRYYFENSFQTQATTMYYAQLPIHFMQYKLILVYPPLFYASTLLSISLLSASTLSPSEK
ncbi:hypothetical protein T265_14819, partial [Opisthorchis viverrini]